MNRRVQFTSSNGDYFDVFIRGANIVHIYRNNNINETPYDDLSMNVREEILIAIISELAKD